MLISAIIKILDLCKIRGIIIPEMILCPAPGCGMDIDFKTLSKNEWCAIPSGIELVCPHCRNIVVVKIEK